MSPSRVVPPAVRALGQLAGKKRAASGAAAAGSEPLKAKAGASKKRKASDAAATATTAKSSLPEEPKTPKRDSAGRLVFADHPTFRPRFTPKQMIEAGVFGGCYFNPRGGKKGILGPSVDIDHREFPASWFDGVPERLYLSRRYNVPTNKYGVKAGQDQAFWEEKGWILAAVDPRGWFQWQVIFSFVVFFLSFKTSTASPILVFLILRYMIMRQKREKKRESERARARERQTERENEWEKKRLCWREGKETTHPPQLSPAPSRLSHPALSSPLPLPLPLPLSP